MSNESNETLSEDHALVIATVVEHHEDELALEGMLSADFERELQSTSQRFDFSPEEPSTLFASNQRDRLASIVRDLAAWGYLDGNESGFRATEKARLSA